MSSLTEPTAERGRQDGLTLVGLLVSLAIGVIVILGFATFMGFYGKTKSATAMRLEAYKRSSARLLQLMNQSYASPDLSLGSHQDATANPMVWHIVSEGGLARLKRITVTERYRHPKTGQVQGKETVSVSGVRFDDF